MATRAYTPRQGRGCGVILTTLLLLLATPLFSSAGLLTAQDGVASIGDYHPAADGLADDSDAIHQAIEALAETGGELIIPRGRYLVNGITVPDNVNLLFRSGGVIVVPVRGEFRINGRIDAGIEPIFAGEGRVTGSPKNLQIYPQWFGARGDGEHNDAPALQKAADLAAGSMGFTLFIPDGEYLFEDDVEFRSNIESRGLLVKQIVIDEARTQFSNFTFVPTHHPENNPHIFFAPDHEELELEPDPFFGVEEGQFNLPAYSNVALAGQARRIDLAEGGTLRFYSSDFFSSRNNQKGDQFYDKNDLSQIVSGRGDIFPELAFSYDPPPEAEPWTESATYRKGDYVSLGGEIFKATWPSGPGSIFEDRFLGTVEIGPVSPRSGEATTSHAFVFENGSEDSINLWRRVETRVWYRAEDRPVTVNGLRLEIRLEGHEGESKRINAGAVNVNRSNMSFNNLEISVRDREATISRLLNISQAANLEFSNGYFSGATYHGLGYNILNFNVANIRYYNTVSVNSRKGLDGRHAKNITISGGHFGVIDDHYGRNYIIRDVVMTGRTTDIPGYVSPDADLQRWGFRTIRPFGFSGTNFHIENVTINDGSGGILSARGDIGDLYGRVTLRNITVRRNEGDVRLFQHEIRNDFDFAGPVRVPDLLLIEDVHLENPGRLNLVIGSGFDGGSYGPVTIRNSGPIGSVYSSSSSLRFEGCSLQDSEFNVQQGSRVDLNNCVFYGNVTGLTGQQIGRATRNSRARDAEVSFPIEFLNPEIYQVSEQQIND